MALFVLCKLSVYIGKMKTKATTGAASSSSEEAF